jgi:hypothetical protein
MVEHLIHHPLVLPIVHRRKHTVRAFVEFIDGRVTRKRLQRSLQKRALKMALRLFSSPPPSVFLLARATQLATDITG